MASTFLDWGTAVDYLRGLAKSEPPLDLTHVAAIGHSARALAALWVAARGKLPEGATFAGVTRCPCRPPRRSTDQAT